ncbi:MAG: hypothetical protein JNK37_24915 [Verrucomicrobiales bacterium]|nr:hypothetical protein [Verrucomicrobiales bacterium]
MPTMLSPKVKAGCGVVAVFGLGFGLGFLTLLFVLIRVVPLSEGWKTDRSREFVANHLANQLKLTDEQRAAFRPLVDEALAARWELRRDYLTRDRQLLEEVYLPKARELLTEPQREEAQRLLERWRRNQSFKVAPEAGETAPPAAAAEPK